MAEFNAAMLGYTGALTACLQLMGPAVLCAYKHSGAGGAWVSITGLLSSKQPAVDFSMLRNQVMSVSRACNHQELFLFITNMFHVYSEFCGFFHKQTFLA
jgi:hypothetical protein